ncbi:MAG: hypothetical protein H6709_23810 [Kofleriaceae bacterium]|nr:hypothetical protein [Kofleriaceae bacterium]
MARHPLATSVALALASAALAACPRSSSPAASPAAPPAASPAAPAGARGAAHDGPAAADPPGPPLETVACAVDADCELRPSESCCGDCDGPPYEAVTRAEADALLIETEQRCSIEEWDCDADPGCEPAPPGCTARAACVDGRCAAVTSGCDG